MKLIELALDAAARDRVARARQHEAWLREQEWEVERLVALMFGMPFAEAFDREKTRYADEGYTIIDGYIFLSEDEGCLRVTVWRKDGGPTEQYVGHKTFTMVGPDHYDENLLELGLLLAKAHTTKEAA